MTTYLVPLLAFVALCASWALFQLWLAKTDPEAAERGNRCSGCNGQCQKERCAADESASGA